MAFRFASIARRAFTRNYTSANSQQAGKAFREESMYCTWRSHCVHSRPDACLLFSDFDSNIWRNTALAVIAGVAWYRIDQHVTELGEVNCKDTSQVSYHWHGCHVSGEASFYKVDWISHEHKCREGSTKHWSIGKGISTCRIQVGICSMLSIIFILIDWLYRLISQDAQRAPIYRMRYPE